MSIIPGDRPCHPRDCDDARHRRPNCPCGSNPMGTSHRRRRRRQRFSRRSPSCC
jgi:hypothetical protein